MPPLGLFPILFVSFPLLLWLVDGARSSRGAFAAGWCFGFGFFVAGLYWISNALLVEADRFAWLIPFPACGLPALLPVFPGSTTRLQHRFNPEQRRDGKGGVRSCS